MIGLTLLGFVVGMTCFLFLFEPTRTFITETNEWEDNLVSAVVLSITLIILLSIALLMEGVEWSYFG